ncbi:S-layer homology domain-containing protein [Thiolapillus brandeum]|uniref:S-layer homology domain-containing protein n=1 Tax=Thiolapillus brandeum TaxID=1076588 RepID=UPI00155B2B66|nr:S-layer homology domain-containing protein [Thiolapillus brandeum]
MTVGYIDSLNETGTSVFEIPAGTSSTNYSITVPTNPPGDWRMYYLCDGCGVYVRKGYYSSTGTTWDIDAATWLADGMDHTGIDLNLLPAYEISGTLFLPNADLAPAGGIWLDVQTWDTSGGAGSFGDNLAFFAEGTNSTSYSAMVPQVAEANWIVGYVCWDCGSYVNNGFYAAAGTTWDPGISTLVAGDSDHTDIDLTLLPGVQVTGLLSYPPGYLSPPGGSSILVTFEEQGGAHADASFSFDIGEGESSTAYSLTVPRSATSQWLISYECLAEAGCNGFVQTGYYATNDTTWKQSAATPLSGTQDHAGIDLTLLTQMFDDVSRYHIFYHEIGAIAFAGITSGCGDNNYCPDDIVSRAQMAVFLEKGMQGSSFVPPPAGGTLFDDVGVDYWAAAWIEQLVTDGITSGCDANNYCPENSVTRAQMAIFLLRAKYGSAYAPPPASGTIFSDVPLTHWAASWIEALAGEGITTGCGEGNYCPDESVSRGQMAVFIQRTFNLPLPDNI